MEVSDTPFMCEDIYFDSEVTRGKPTLALLAVLLGKIGATKSSVRILLYDKPTRPPPKCFIKKYARRNPSVVFVTTLARDKMKNRSHGTIQWKPEKPSRTSIVPVKLATSIVINKNATVEQTSSIIPAIEAMKMIAIWNARGDNPDCGSRKNHASAAQAATAQSLRGLIFLLI
jgi:hypothetical protein